MADSPQETDTFTRTVATCGESYITFVSQLEDTPEFVVAESPQETDTSTRTVATLVDTSISSSGSADVSDSLTSPPVSKSTTHITPALAVVIRPIYAPRLPKAFTRQKELTYEIKYTQRELVVKRSEVEVDSHFTTRGLYRGWGLFTPAQHRGRGMWQCGCMRVRVCASVQMFAHNVCVRTVQENVTKRHTEELEFKGEHVLHVLASDMQLWQREYCIQDTFNTDKVFVPSTPSCVCRLFRVQHNVLDPTHTLAQINEETCVLVSLRKLGPDSEITIDYFR